MLYYDAMLFLKELMLIKQLTPSKEDNICHYWYFLNYSFNFQPNVCNRWHDSGCNLEF